MLFFLRKTSTVHTSNFCSGMPLRKVHELTFLWFGLPGPLRCMSKKGPIWQSFVLPLLTFRDRIFKTCQIVPFLPCGGCRKPLQHNGKKKNAFLPNRTLSAPHQGPPTEVKIGKSGKRHFCGRKMPFLGGPSWNHLNGRFGTFNSLPQQEILVKGGN